MTITCPGDACPFCTGEACHACGGGPVARRCNHDRVERHAARQPIRDTDDAGERPGTPTAPLAPLAGVTLEIEVADPDVVAEAAETFARIVRARGRVKITIG